MRETVGEIWSIEWWLSVVVVGIAIHLLAAYLKPRIDRLGMGVSQRWALGSEKRARARLGRIKELRGSELRRLAAGIQELRFRVTSVGFICIAVGALVLGIWFNVRAEVGGVAPRILGIMCGILTVLSLMMCLGAHLGAVSIYGEITEGSEGKESKEGEESA